MMGNIIFVSFVIFSLFQFFEGVRIGMDNPLLFLAGALSLVLFLLFIHLPGSGITKEITIEKTSLVAKIRRNRITRFMVVLFLWILTIGNFVYATNWVGTPISKGVEYFEAAVLALISYSLLNDKIKET